MRHIFVFVAIVLALGARAQELQLAYFQCDVTPPLGSPLCGGAVKPAEAIDDPLSARGVVLLPEGQPPVVLCAVDWVGIANDGWDTWRAALAEAAGTQPERVAVQCLHQHDAPFCDFATERLLAEHGLGGASFDAAFGREAIARAAQATKSCLQNARSVTHVGHGQAKVLEVASSRRVLGADGKVQYIRWSATKDPAARAREEGTIDPYVKLISFWNGEQPLAVLSYYATHPQSHYGEGHVSADFVGMARAMREAALPGVPHIHFDGAGGNVTAGKYNDGASENRPLLAKRLAEGMRKAWEATEKTPLSGPLIWKTLRVSMPVRPEIVREEMVNELADPGVDKLQRIAAAREVVWLDRAAGDSPETELSLLRLGEVNLLHMAGELFVEYQLAAQAMRPQSFVVLAAYGDYGPGYIGTSISYTQGGYETQLRVSRTAPEVEPVLMKAMQQLLSEEP